MKEIKAYIRPEKANEVVNALENNGINGMTVINVSMLGKWADQEQSSLSIDFCQKYCTSIKIELICNKTEVDKIIKIILSSGRTGRKGDGKIFVSDIENAYSIRTQAEGIEAIN